MIRLILLLLAGVGIGYSYGYLQGEAGEDSITQVAMATIGIDVAVDHAQGSIQRVRREERQRQATIDSIKQARADSAASLIHR